jgi:hypothetical protein
VDNFSKSVTLPVATSNPDIIAAECMSLFRALKAPVTELRGVSEDSSGGHHCGRMHEFV